VVAGDTNVNGWTLVFDGPNAVSNDRARIYKNNVDVSSSWNTTISASVSASTLANLGRATGGTLAAASDVYDVLVCVDVAHNSTQRGDILTHLNTLTDAYT
jgi:hypothetical protein